MKLLILLSLFAQICFAQKKEAEVLERIYKLDKALETSPLYEACKGDIENYDPLVEDHANKLDACFTKELEKFDDKEIEELGKNLEVSSFGVKDVKNANSIREFLTERLRKGLYGDNYDEKKKKLKSKNKTLVGHDQYYKLYKSQLSKTIIMEVNRYCLENFRVKNDNTVEDIYLDTPNANQVIIGKVDQSVADRDAVKQNLKEIIDTFSLTEQPFSYKLLKDIPEPNSLTKKFKDKSETIGQYANLYNTDKEVGFNKNSPANAKYFEKKAGMCINALTLMCGCYNFKCKKHEGSEDYVGKIACTIQAKIREHRKKFEVLEESIKVVDKMKSQNGFRADGQNVGFYDGKSKGQSTVDELTNITSTEILDQVKGLEDEDMKASLDLIQQCETDATANENCEAILGEKATELRKSDVIKLEAEKIAKLEKIKKLKNDEMKEFLNDNGYKDLLKKLNEGTLNEDDVRKIISEQFKAEKESVIEEMNRKLKMTMAGQKQKPSVASGQAANTALASPFTQKEVVEEEKTKIKIKRDRFADVLHYSNVVSSYLSVKDDKDKVIGQNTQALKQEYEEYQKGESQDQNRDYWDSLQADANAPIKDDIGASSAIDLGMIDRILGSDTSSDQKANIKKTD